jgi:NADP-dependent 3-hydroxy acid dehydrogenase YdfG
MSINPIGLAYCVDNEDIARDIQSLLGNYARFRTFVAGGDNGNLPLAEQIRQFGGPCILLVSDNFLRSAACMYGGLSLVQDMQYRLLPVVVDGKKDGRAIPTSFERVTDIIQYINYWQDQYLDLRRQRHELSGLDEDTFNEHLRLVREISSEAGEFLRHLRSLDHYSFVQFAANDYYAFFSFIDDEPAWTAFKSRTMAGGVMDVVTDGREEEPEEVLVSGTQTDIDDVDAGVGAVIEGIEIDILPNLVEEEEWQNLPEEVEGYEDGEDEDPQTATEPQGSPAEPSEEDNTVAPEEEDELDIPIMLEKAWGLASKGDLEAGLNLLDMLLEEYPQDSEIRYHLAMMLADKNDVPAAVRELRKILDAGEMHEDALSLLVDLYMETSDYDNARNTLTQLLQLNTQHEAGWLSLGELILRQDPEDVESARYAFGRVLKLNPRNERALWFHASVCARMDSHLTEALQSLNYLLSIVPDHAEALSLRQKLHEQEAEREREKAARENANAQRGTDGNPETGQYVNPTENTGGGNEDGGHPATGQGATSGGDEVDTTIPQPLEAPPVEDPANEPDTGTHEAGPEAGSGTTGESSPAEGVGTDTGQPITTNVDINTPQPTASTPEHNPLQALKENIAQLEALLRAHEEAEKRAKEALAALQAAVPAKPGTGKTVLISGATSGIGKATAQRFAQEGYRLILTGRRADRLQSLQDQLVQQTGAEVLLLNFDVRDAGAVQAAVDGLPDNWRQIDILINNAGKAKGLDFIFQGQEDHWEEMIDTNIKGLLYLTRAISPGMVARRSGHIINVGSTAGKEVYPKGSVYCATKFAVDALTKGMRMDLYDKGIRVSQVSPAHVEETEFALVRFDGDEERARQVYDNFQPLKAADVAAVILFMASQPSHVNVLDVVVQSSQQASSTMIDRSGRAE